MPPRHHLTTLLVALALAGCGTDSDRSWGVSRSAVTATAEITVVDFAYEPATLTVVPGTTVTWVNADDFAHTVTSGPARTPDGTFDEPLGSPDRHGAAGTTATVTFDTPGTYPYACALHPGMVGEVVVAP